MIALDKPDGYRTQWLYVLPLNDCLTYLPAAFLETFDTHKGYFIQSINKSAALTMIT